MARGCGWPDGRVVARTFIGQALKNKPLTVFGEGGQTQSFCYCSDLIDGICRLMMSGVNDPVNIGNPVETTVLEFARTKSSGPRGRAAKLCSARFRRTILGSGGRTLEGQRRFWDGRQKWRWPTV